MTRRRSENFSPDRDIAHDYGADFANEASDAIGRIDALRLTLQKTIDDLATTLAEAKRIADRIRASKTSNYFRDP
jgi:hypothetical protein